MESESFYGEGKKEWEKILQELSDSFASWRHRHMLGILLAFDAAVAILVWRLVKFSMDNY